MADVLTDSDIQKLDAGSGPKILTDADIAAHEGASAAGGNPARARRQANARTAGTKVTPLATEQQRSAGVDAQGNPLPAPSGPQNWPANQLYQGGQGMARGIQEFAQPGVESKFKGASDVVRGGMQASAPFLLPLGMATKPIGTLAGLVGGTVTGVGTEAALKGVGVPPGYAEAAGTATGLYGGKKAYEGGAKLDAKVGNYIANRPVAAENTEGYKPLGPAVEKAAQALGGGANNPYFADSLAKVLPRIKAQEGSARSIPNVVNPNIGPVGDVPWRGKYPFSNAPEHIRLTDIEQANQLAIKSISDKEKAWFEDPLTQAGTRVDAGPIIDAINKAPTMYASRANPEIAAAANQRANQLYKTTVYGQDGKPITFNKKLTVPDLIKYKEGVNAALDSFMDQNPGMQRSALSRDPRAAAMVAEGKAIRDALYGLDPSGQWRDMEQAKGAHIEVGDYISAQKNNALGFDPKDSLLDNASYFARGGMQAFLHEPRGAASNISQGLTRSVVGVKGAGGKLADALKLVDVPPAEWQPPKWGGALATTPKPSQNGPGSDFTMPPPGGGRGIHFTGQVGPGAPPAQLPPARIPPQRQLPASSAPSGPPIQMPGGAAPIVTPPPPMPQELLGPDSSGPIPPILPQNYLPPGTLPPPPTAARGASVMGIPKPPRMPQAPKGPTAAVRQEKVRNQFRGAKQRLDRQFMGMAKANKIGSYGVPPGVLTDQQSTQYNTAVKALTQQQEAELAQIPPDPPNGPMAPIGAPMPPDVVPQAAAGGATVQGPSPVIVGEPGPERIDHSDGRPSEVVNGTQVVNLGQNGSTDKVTPLTPFPEKGIIRGSANIPLSPEGQQQAAKLGQQLAKAGGMDKIYSSDLSRTQETAQHIAQATGAQLQPPQPGLRSWALGYLEGQPGSDGTDQIIAHHINAVPDEPVPGQGPVSTQPGESFNQFKNRVIPSVQNILQEQAAQPHTRVNIVTHNRDEKLLRAFYNAGGTGDLDKRVFAEEGGEPGSMSKIAQVAPGRYRVEDFDPTKSPTLPGVYLTRHAATSWNSPKGGGGS